MNANLCVAVWSYPWFFGDCTVAMFFFFGVGLKFLVAGVATPAVNQMFLIMFQTMGRHLL